MMQKRLYFDDNATTPLLDEVRDGLCESLNKFLGNPSSSHAEGQGGRRDLERARIQIASLLHADAGEVYFTSSASEANNLAITSAWKSRPSGKNRIYSTRVEHESVLKPLKILEQSGAKISWIESDKKGNLQVLDRLSGDTALVCCMLTNNETGVINTVHELSLKARQTGALLLTDGACAFGKTDISFQELGADYLTTSAHKFHGPRGAGFLVARKGSPLVPSIWGGNQERGVRSGTENVWAICGMAHALELVTRDLQTEIERVKGLRKLLVKGVMDLGNVTIVENPYRQMPGTLSVIFQGIKGRTLLTALDLEGVSVSLGSACQSGSLDPSHVLMGMGYSEEESLSAIRFSFGRLIGLGEIKELLTRLKTVLSRVRQ